MGLMRTREKFCVNQPEILCTLGFKVCTKVMYSIALTGLKVMALTGLKVMYSIALTGSRTLSLS